MSCLLAFANEKKGYRYKTGEVDESDPGVWLSALFSQATYAPQESYSTWANRKYQTDPRPNSFSLLKLE